MCPSVILDLKWWLELLSVPHPPLSIATPPPPLDLSIWVDASSDFGISLLFDQAWSAWHLVPDWRGPSRDIGWLESLAIELAVSLVIRRGFHDCSICIHSDNEGSIAAYQKGRSRNFMSNLCIRRTALASFGAGISLELMFVPSAENLADPISRGLFPPYSPLLDPPPLDSSLSSFFLHGSAVAGGLSPRS